MPPLKLPSSLFDSSNMKQSVGMHPIKAASLSIHPKHRILDNDNRRVSMEGISTTIWALFFGSRSSRLVDRWLFSFIPIPPDRDQQEKVQELDQLGERRTHRSYTINQTTRLVYPGERKGGAEEGPLSMDSERYHWKTFPNEPPFSLDILCRC